MSRLHGQLAKHLHLNTHGTLLRVHILLFVSKSKCLELVRGKNGFLFGRICFLVLIELGNFGK